MTSKATGAKLVVLNACVASFACMGGGFANNWFMRMPETKIGIEIQDPANGKTVGVSKICA